jgi:DNA-binding LytR/AlgR family response regulator
VRLAGETDPDLALVDVQLAHGTNGVEAAREMLARHHLRSLFVTSDGEAARAAKDAAIGCLQKPYSGADLVAAVQAAEQTLKNIRATASSSRLEWYCDAAV